jgi:integrase
MLYSYAMSSIHRQDGKPNLFCAFYDPEGFRRFRTTGTADRRIATSVCTVIERMAGLAKQGKLSNEKALKIIREKTAEIEEGHGRLPAQCAEKVMQSNAEEFIRIAGGELVSYSIRSWLDSWLNGHTDASKATRIEYQRVLDVFFKFLGTRADRPLTTLQESQVEAFKQSLITRVAPSTVNKSVKVLKAAFANAVAKRQLEFSPARHVAPVGTEDSQRRPFTMDEIRRALAAADEEWQTMILTAFYTGLRLRDCANLTWQGVDLLRGTIEVTTEKTSRPVVVPIAEPLARHLSTLAGDKPDAPLCPALFQKSASRLSAQFYKIMVKAGLAKERNHEGTGKGRDVKRDASQISFHSLRHSITSALKSAGVSDSVAMDIVGHETTAISRNYTKIADSAKREAINKLPDITTP